MNDVRLEPRSVASEGLDPHGRWNQALISGSGLDLRHLQLSIANTGYRQRMMIEEP